MVTRPDRRAVAAVAAASVVVAAILVALALGREGGGGVVRGDPITARPLVTPTEQLFGDLVTAELRVVVDPSRVDPDAVAVKPSFEPYEALGGVSTERREVGGGVELRYRWRLGCFEEDCLPAATRFFFPDAVVEYGRGRSFAVEWPQVGVGTRLQEVDAQTEPMRAALTEVPRPSFAISPKLLAAILLALATALVLAAGALVVRALPWREPVPEEPEPEPLSERDLTPLERAVLLVRSAAAGGDGAAQRRALDTLARELETSVDGHLTADARRLAWSEAPPPRAAVEALADRVEREAR